MIKFARSIFRLMKDKIIKGKAQTNEGGKIPAFIVYEIELSIMKSIGFPFPRA